MSASNYFGNDTTHKICFLLNSPEAVEYANAHRETDFGDYGRLEADRDKWFHIPAFKGRGYLRHLDDNWLQPGPIPGYTDVTQDFLEKIYRPWKERLKDAVGFPEAQKVDFDSLEIKAEIAEVQKEIDEVMKGAVVDKAKLQKSLPVRPSLYAMYYGPLKEIAHKHGYNLCIHGSMNRDFDLVAFPWKDSANPKHFEVADEMREFLGGQFNDGFGNRCEGGAIWYPINIWRSTPFTAEKDQQFYLDLKIYPSPSKPDHIPEADGYLIYKGDEVNSFLAAILRRLNVDQMCALRDALIERTPSPSREQAVTAEGWISVGSGLPKLWGNYLVASGQWAGSAHFDGEFYDYSVNKMKQSSRYKIPATHWMPLPAPPEEYKSKH